MATGLQDWHILSHIFVFYTRWQTNTIPCFWEIQSPVEAKYTKRTTAPQFPADGGCCFGFASKFLTELSASKCENRPAQKIDTHTLIYLSTHLIPNWQICFAFLVLMNIVINIFVFSINKSPQKKEPDGPDAKVTPCKRHRQAPPYGYEIKTRKNSFIKLIWASPPHCFLLLSESKVCFTKFPVPLLSQKRRQKADFIVLLL